MDPEIKESDREYKLCVVSPCLNEEASICEFIERIIAIKIVDHLVLVDDGSNDNTIAKILESQQKHFQNKIPTQIILLEFTKLVNNEA